MKKIFNYIAVATIISLGIIVSEKTTIVVKNVDTLMTEIKQNQQKYTIQSKNAKIINNAIIPGVNGKTIDIQKTYNEMKKIGKFNDKYIIYQQIQPEITIENKYDKYIISGNKEKNTVSLIFLLYEDTNIDKIRDILNRTNTKATFFINTTWLEKHNDDLQKLIREGHTIGNLDYNTSHQETQYRWIDTILKTTAKQTKYYCYNKQQDKTILNKCTENKHYTITPNIKINSDPLPEIKKQITPGAIMELPINDRTNNELELVIKYINAKGYKIKNLEEHLSEKNNN